MKPLRNIFYPNRITYGIQNTVQCPAQTVSHHKHPGKRVQVANRSTCNGSLYILERRQEHLIGSNRADGRASVVAFW